MLSAQEYNVIKRTGETLRETSLILNEKTIEIELENRTINLVCTNQYISELIAGRTYVEQQELHALQAVFYKNEWVFAMADRMEAGMPIHEKTRGAHSCFLYKKGELLFACEDMGRHNAMDKVIGYALLNDIDLKKCAVYSSGRVPEDMVEKTIRAGIPILVSKGVPTFDAVELAKRYQMTLICGARRDQMKIYSDYRKNELDVLILAGGKSSRMGGKHKGSLMIGEKTFVQNLITEVANQANKVYLSYGSDVHRQYEGCEIVMDVYKDCGPMGGIHAGLLASEAEYVFAAACDMPFMRAEFIDELKKYLVEDIDIVVPVLDGKMNPLASIYHKKTVLPVVEELLANGNYKLRSIFENVNVKYVDIKDEALKKMIQNINTLEEYEGIDAKKRPR